MLCGPKIRTRVLKNACGRPGSPSTGNGRAGAAAVRKALKYETSAIAEVAAALALAM